MILCGRLQNFIGSRITSSFIAMKRKSIPHR